GVFALGTVGYFWYQLHTPYALVNANPPRPAGEAAVAAAAETTAPARPAAAPTGQGPIPGLPGSTALPSPTPARTPAAASSPTQTLAVPKPAARPHGTAGSREPGQVAAGQRPGRRRAVFHARQPARAAGPLGRGAAVLLQGVCRRSGQRRFRLQPRGEPRSPAPAQARARVLRSRACAGGETRRKLRDCRGPQPRAAARPLTLSDCG